MTRYPGDQGGNPPAPRDPRNAFPGLPYGPAQPPQPGGPTVQPMQPPSAGRSGHGEEETAGFHDRGQYQLAPGTQLQNGRYLIESVIGKGGMGHVYRAMDTRLSRVRAIKEMIPQMGDPEAALINYKREAKVMLDLEHPSIPQVFDTF